jgi:hypothetical protein
MKIGTVPPNRPAQTDETTPMRVKKEAQPKKQAVDTIEVSENARKKLAEAADNARTTLLNGAEGSGAKSLNDLSGSERITRLRQRVESGYYERPEIKKQIAESLADDIKP